MHGAKPLAPNETVHAAEIRGLLKAAEIVEYWRTEMSKSMKVGYLQSIIDAIRAEVKKLEDQKTINEQ